MLELKEVKRKNKNKQATKRGTDRREKNKKEEKRKTMQCTGRKEEEKKILQVD